MINNNNDTNFFIEDLHFKVSAVFSMCVLIEVNESTIANISKKNE